MKRIMQASKLWVIPILFLAFVPELSAQVVVRRPAVTVVHRPVVRPYVYPVARPVVVAPVALPRYYAPVYYAGNPYYYANGVFYVRIEQSDSYKVVLPPVGTIVPNLPDGAHMTIIDDREYYEFGDVIYKKVLVENLVKYEVVGYTKS
ncbi:DUF6515 family protein [Allomuricauda sp. M10]|uniref:DUF6515 family protein n=1 Tax=Allomuricauda sp. M10 TaxID=2683292 RepID=UPI001D19490F|nr:DUF6515 family protein [Muricauda sp. M10]